MDALYREQILEHYKHPHNFGELAEADLEFEDNNPLCGDELKVLKSAGLGAAADWEESEYAAGGTREPGL